MSIASCSTDGADRRIVAGIRNGARRICLASTPELSGGRLRSPIDWDESGKALRISDIQNLWMAALEGRLSICSSADHRSETPGSFRQISGMSANSYEHLRRCAGLPATAPVSSL